MGDTKLWLFFFLTFYTFAEQSAELFDEETEVLLCPLSTRYRTFKKYIYEYTAESTNGVTGTANLKNGPKISCKVELEVPQVCRFVLHTTDCTLSEVSDIDSQGQPVYMPSAESETFEEAMKKSPLSFVVEQVTNVSIYPEENEPENIVNIKRGIISALLVPVMDNDLNKKMTSIHGVCHTDLTVNEKKDIDIDVTVVRDLSACNHFYPRSLPTSHLSLISGLNGLFSRLIRSSQTCNYRFDNRRKHMTDAQCTENHIFVPFSHKAQNGINSEVKQSLTLKDSMKAIMKQFNTNGNVEKKLFPEEKENNDKSLGQSKEDMVKTMKKLNGLTHSGQNKERASLFQKLVVQTRGMHNKTLSSVVEEIMEISKGLTWQVLLQCGTSECTSAILQILRNSGEPAWKVDASVYSLSLMPHSTPQHIRDMLSMAEHRPSKSIMYALANTVKKFSHEHAMNTPEVKEVAEFMKFMLGDCSGDEDKTFLTLRVIGVMGKHMQGFQSLKSSLLSCSHQRHASLSVQKSAIQAFRLMDIDSEVISRLLQVFQDSSAAAQKRIAAYLMLMRNPEATEDVIKTLKNEKNLQVKSFVVSHISHLLDNPNTSLQKVKDYITKALKIEDNFPYNDFTKSSQNFKIAMPSVASIESNIIFDNDDHMPTEVMLATTLDIFNIELLEIGLEGEGFASVIEALFGENGFFPDTLSKAMYWANDQVSPQISSTLKKWLAPLEGNRMKREIPEDITRQIMDNVKKVKQGLKFLEENKDTTNAMAYLRLMGTELGYMKTSELNGIVENIMSYITIYLKDALSMSLQKLLSGTDNEIFAHYMFLDKAFTLPTGSGFPLKFSLAGIFAPGAAGGLKFTNGMKHISFRPSVGLEFITEMGIYFPEFINAGIRMHNNVYHESSLNAKLTLSANQFKVSLPVPKENIQLIKISNEVFSLTSTTEKKLSFLMEDNTDSPKCNPIFPGMTYCTKLLNYNTPFYPLSGGSRFAVELQPTGDILEYTSSVAYELLREGKEGRHKVDSVVLSLKAEGNTPVEATANFKYNRNKNSLSSEFQIPDFDVEAAFKLGAMDSTGKEKHVHGITVEISNNKNLQIYFSGRCRMESMKDAKLELEMAIPALQVNASAIASLKNVNGLVVQLETAFHIPETSTLHKASLKYDENKIELETKSNVNFEVIKLIPGIKMYQIQLQNFIDNILDQQVTKTDMKLRHIVSKGIEAGYIWLEKFGKDIPYVKNLKSKRSIPELTLPSIPEKLYHIFDAYFRYQFNKDKMFFSIPVPLGGKSFADLKIPSVFSIPSIKVLGLEIPETKHRIPSFTIPQVFDVSLPMLGMAEASVQVKSNFYEWEGSISGGNYSGDDPSYIAKYKVITTCPITPLSYKVEGTAMVTGTIDDNLKYLVNGSLNHIFLDATFGVVKSMEVFDKLRTIYKFEATSPFGVQTSLYCSSQLVSANNEITGNTNADGIFKLGPFYANTIYSETLSLNLLEGTGKGYSIFKFNSSIIHGETVTSGEYRNKELSIVSRTSAYDGALKHTAEVKYKDGQLSLKSGASSTAMGKILRFQADFQTTMEKASLKVETQAQDATSRAFSLLVGSLNDNGLEINMDGSINLENCQSVHKGKLSLGMTGLATSCSTTLLCNSVNFEKIFNADINRSGASFTLKTTGSSMDNTAELDIMAMITEKEMTLNCLFKGNIFDNIFSKTTKLALNNHGLTLSTSMAGTLQKMRTESTHNLTITLWTLVFQSKMNNFICDGESYNHDIRITFKPFVASMFTKCKLEMFDISVSKEVQLKIEPFKMDATGTINGQYEEDNTIKTTCAIHLSDFTGLIKCVFTGEVLESQISHNLDLEFAGLASVFKSEFSLNSKSLRLENTVRTMAMPFSLTVDAIFNSDGSVNFYGKHSGQLYSKFLLKAEPFAIAKSHDWRASLTHNLLNGDSAETLLENKFDGLLIPNAQSFSWSFKSKLNSHAYNQNVNIYNKEDNIGFQLSGVLQTNLFNTATELSSPSFDNEEFSILALLNYDKNSNCHIIDLPFTENFPIAFEKIKNTVVSILESLQQYLNNLDISALVRQFRENLDKVPQKVSVLIKEVDIESKLTIAKDTIISLAQDYTVTLDDLEANMDNFMFALEKKIINIATKIRDLKSQMKDLFESEPWSETLRYIADELKDLNKKFYVAKTILTVLGAIEDIIGQINLQKLHDKNWLKNLDATYNIRATFLMKLGELKHTIDNFDILTSVQNLIDYISSNLAQYMDQLSDHIPAEDLERVVASMRDVIVNWIDEYEIVEKINFVYLKIGELYKRYEIRRKLELFVEQTITLIKQYNVEKTIEIVIDNVKSIPFEYCSDKFMQALNSFINKLKFFDIKQNFDDLLHYIQEIITYLKTFNYDAFVDEANEKISKATNSINEQIKRYEIPRKIEASREYLRKLQGSIFNYMEHLQNTKVAEVYRMIKGIVDSTAYKDIKLKIQDMFEDMRQRISDMDIRDEILVYLERASKSYVNIIDYIYVQLKKIIDSICKDQQKLDQILQILEEILNSLKMAKIDIPSFTIPYTTLQLSSFQISIDRIQDITIPSVIFVPDFTILKTFHVSEVTINFEKIKQKILEFIDHLREFEIPELDPQTTFGDLRVFYFFKLPDLTFPEIKLVEFRIPKVIIPKLSTENFEITMLPIPEVKLPQIPFEPCIPTFGKLFGEFKLNSPFYTVMTTAAIHNTTTKSLDPQFKVTFSSQAKSPIQLLGYNLDAMIQIEAPKMKTLVITETLNANHIALKINHEGSLAFSGPSAEAKAKTTAIAPNEMFKADFVNDITFSVKNGISVTINTNYNHNFDIPTQEALGQATLTKEAKIKVESGTFIVTCKNMGNWIWSVKDYSDEGTHKSFYEFSIISGTAKFTIDSETNSNTLKLKQLVNGESVILSHFIIDISVETETPFMKKSLLKLSGKGQDLKLELNVSHNAEVTGRVSGTVSNTFDFLAQPFIITIDCQNKFNSKTNLPLKLAGKLDFQHDCNMIVSSAKQYASCMSLARFNQYKYNHNFTLHNQKTNAGIYVSADGEANLDFLTVPVTVPAITVPFCDIETPIIKDFSLWEDLGLKDLLTTSRQSFDIDFKLQYQKNMDTHNFDLDLKPIYSFIDANSKLLEIYFELGRDKIYNALKNSYNKARTQFKKFNVDTTSYPPQYVTIPGYTVPILDIEVSPFRAELPAVSYFIPKEVSTPSFKVPVIGFLVPSYTIVIPSPELPVIHVPRSMSELTLPHLTFPNIQNKIMIPALGNFTCDFSLKSSVISFHLNGGLYNQSDILVKLDTSSTSVYELLKGKLDSTSIITTKKCLKVSTTLALDHKNGAYTHNSILSVTKRNIEASLENIIKLSLPIFKMDLNQKLNGNTKTKPNFVSNIQLQYTYSLPLINNNGKVIMDHDFQLEALSSYVSLDSSLRGKFDGTLMKTGHFSESFKNEVTIYLNINGLRSTLKTDVVLEGDYKKTKLWNIETTQNVELEASLKRIYATFNHTNNNTFTIASFSSQGKHLATGSFEFVPLATISAKFNIDISQPSSLGPASVLNNIDLAVLFNEQKLIWHSKEHLLSVKHSSDFILTNNESEIRMELTRSIEGNAAFLKSIKLPVYQKTLWDVLKFDKTTSTDKLQFLNVALHLVYTKSMDGILFNIPAQVFDNGAIFTLPEFTLNVPEWVKHILQMIKESDERLHNAEVPDFVSVPPEIIIPGFVIPFTTARVPTYTLDPQNLKIPNVIRVHSFMITFPGLPNIKFPTFEIDLKYMEDKMALLSVNLPQYDITISQFTLPKSLSVGKHTISLDNIVKALCNFEMPTISIPEQKIEIPKILFYLPTGVFIPSFGALSTTMKVSSPIYNSTWTANMENKGPDIVYTLTSSCTSTMVFLGYDLEAIASVTFDNGAVSLDGKCNFSHSDVNINWKHQLQRSLRAKRDEPSATRPYRHIFDVDLTSQTFADVRFQYASFSSGITSSVTSPAGFVGFQLTKRSPSQYHGKLFTRSSLSPDKDTDLLSYKVTLKNSVRLNIQTNWYLNGISEMSREFKARLPAITAAIYNFINKYHKAHFGMDLNRASLKFKNELANSVEKAYSKFLEAFATIQDSVEHLSQQNKELLKKTVESVPAGLQEMISRSSTSFRSMLHDYESNVRVVFDAIMKFLSETKFHLPGLEEKLTGQEIYYKVRRSFSVAIKRATSRFTSLIETTADTLASYINDINFSIPGSSVIFNGRNMVKDLKSALKSAQDQINQAIKRWEGMKLEKVLQNVSDFVKHCFLMMREFITSLNGKKLQVLPNYFTKIYNDLENTSVIQEITNQIEITRTKTAEYKDISKAKVQEIYNRITLEHVNSKIIDLITVLEMQFHGDVERYLEYAKNVSQHTQPYIKVTSKKMDVDIPLPFYWNSFSDWPRLYL